MRRLKSITERPQPANHPRAVGERDHGAAPPVAGRGGADEGAEVDRLEGDLDGGSLRDDLSEPSLDPKRNSLTPQRQELGLFGVELQGRCTMKAAKQLGEHLEGGPEVEEQDSKVVGVGKAVHLGVEQVVDGP
jgi:hypothetical protein